MPEERYICIYDASGSRAVVIDTTTGGEFDLPQGELEQLLRMMRRLKGDAALRRFSAWCASQGKEMLTNGAIALIDAAEAAAFDPEGVVQLENLRERFRDVQAAATAIGLPHGSAGAAAFLVAYAACDPDALAAARESARMRQVALRLSSQDEHRVPEEARSQIDVLLDLLNE